MFGERRWPVLSPGTDRIKEGLLNNNGEGMRIEEEKRSELRKEEKKGSYYVTRPWASDIGKHLLNNVIAGAYHFFSSSDHFNSRDSSSGILDVDTSYKKKADKVKPVDLPHKGGLKPEGKEDWRQRAIVKEVYTLGKYSWWIIPKFSTIKKGTRLTTERIEKLNMAKNLMAREKDVFLEVLFNREAAIAFDFTEKGHFSNEIEPLHVVCTIPHTPWQAKNFKIPKALEGEVVKIIKDRVECRALERSFGPYGNPWFLVLKKSEKYRLINSVQKLNAVTIRDASLPPSVDEFSEEFVGFPLISLLDFFSGYDQYSLDLVSQDLTAFMTSFGLMRMAMLQQGYTNGVQVFD